jgi:hypothetical protein
MQNWCEAADLWRAWSLLFPLWHKLHRVGRLRYMLASARLNHIRKLLCSFGRSYARKQADAVYKARQPLS